MVVSEFVLGVITAFAAEFIVAFLGILFAAMVSAVRKYNAQDQ